VHKLALLLVFVPLLAAGTGKQVFENRCAACHGADARGSGKGPGLAANPHLAGQSAEQLRAIIQRGFPTSGMPPFDLPAAELDAVAAYIRELNAGVRPAAPAAKRTRWPSPQPGDWLTYNGHLSANRYSPLKQINTANAAALKLKWLFPIPGFCL